MRSQSKQNRGSVAPGSAPTPAPETVTSESPAASSKPLRAGNDDVEAPPVRLERNGTEARHGIHDDERANVACRLCDRSDICDHTVDVSE
jgi:hypothetical protein